MCTTTSMIQKSSKSSSVEEPEHTTTRTTTTCSWHLLGRRMAALFCVCTVLPAVHHQLKLLHKVTNADQSRSSLEEIVQGLEARLKEKEALVEELQEQSKKSQQHWNTTSKKGSEAKELKPGIETQQESISLSNSTPQQSSVSGLSEHIPADAHIIPPFPETIFTTHTKEVVSVIANVTLPVQKTSSQPFPYNPTKYCSSFRIVVDQPYSPPSQIECTPNFHSEALCIFFQHLFENQTRVLPYNVTVGTSYDDKVRPDTRPWGQCIGNSAPNGMFSMANFQDIKRQVVQTLEARARNRGKRGYRYPYVDWHKKQTTPIFRGQARLRRLGPWKDNPKECPPKAADLGYRVRAAAFSLDHPDLLDAVVQEQPDAVCVEFNATNGLDKIFRWGKYAENTTGLPPVLIQPSEYYTKYQTAVVLGGIGAAFRTARHLSAGQAVVLQDYPFEEWYIPYMKKWTHYIPLRKDLSDLKKIMEWARDHPRGLRKIAQAGQQFYWDYLSFKPNHDHWYELLWRLSLLIHKEGPESLKRGSGTTIWEGKKMPEIYHRKGNGKFEMMNTKAGAVPKKRLSLKPELTGRT